MFRLKPKFLTFTRSAKKPARYFWNGEYITKAQHDSLSWAEIHEHNNIVTSSKRSKPVK